MREHKYRGLTKEGKEIKGSLILSEDGSRAFIGYIECIDEGRVTIVHYEEVLPSTVGEFTGKLDKNGKEIWDGSKVSFTIFDHNDIDTQHTGYVYWDEEDLAWNIKCQHEVFPLGDVLRQDDDFEVIGNVHAECEG